MSVFYDIRIVIKLRLVSFWDLYENGCRWV